MRNKIQKYLSGSREGFSLVELIIVIAIMAILIGVVALAVLPYLEKSRESKDLSTLDTVCSALVTAIADTQTSGSSSFLYDGTDTTNKVPSSMKATLGQGNIALKSSAATKASAGIYCVYDADHNLAYVFAGTSTTQAVSLNRTETGYTSLPTTSSNGQGPNGHLAVVTN